MGDFEYPKLRCPQSGIVVELNSNPFSIGRGLSCNYVTVGTTVSRLQCVLERNEDTWILKDSSTNGTFLNGKLIKGSISSPLKDNDVIKLEPNGEPYVFEMEARIGSDDISDEQLCILADSVLNQVEVLHQGSQNRDNIQIPREATSENSNIVENTVPVTTSAALQDHLGMAKTMDAHLNKKQKTEIGTSIASIISHTSSVDLRDSGTSSVRPDVSSVAAQLPDAPGPSANTDKEPPDVTSTKDIITNPESLHPPQPAADQQDNYEVMENELQCAICSELFVRAVTLTCSHTFCKYCIEMWKKNKSECPICRSKITGMTSTLVLDNVIEKVIEGSSEEIQQHRKEMLEERKIQESAKAAPKENGRGRGRGRRGRRGRADNPDANTYGAAAVEVGPLYQHVIEVSSDSNSDSQSSSNTDYNDLDEWQDEYDNDDWYNDGVPGTYYGGYGHCYSCGRRGHWANGCPYRYI